jgi:hypothetical protein
VALMTRAFEDMLGRLSEFGFGENQKFDPNKLEVPREFQRDEKDRGWHYFVPALFGRLVVVKVGKRLLLVDGQHRNEEAKRAGYTEVPAIFFEKTPAGRAMVLADAAAMFTVCNGQRVALPAPDEFRSAIVAGDPQAVALNDALLARNLDGTGRGQAGYPNVETFKSISSVRSLQYQLGLDHTLYALDVINDIWPFAEVKTSPHARIIRGFGQFLRPQKTVLATAKGRTRQNRRWNPADKQVLVDYLRLRYGDREAPAGTPDSLVASLRLDGMNAFLQRAERRVKGGGGGGGSLGMELVLKDCLTEARRHAREKAAA